MQSPDNNLCFMENNLWIDYEIGNADDLTLLYKKLYDAEDQINDLNLPFAEREVKYQEIIKIFLEKLIENKDKFKLVFKTSNGSVYFVSKNDQCWRFKAIEDSYKEQPIVKKVFFVSQTQANKIKKLQSDEFWQENIINYKIVKTGFDIDTVPVEFGVVGLPEIIFQEDSESLTILGTKYKNQKEIDPSFASGFHLGHPILEIIKK